MSAIIRTLPTTFTGPNVDTLPEYKLDPMLNVGTMFLIEPGVNWSSGIPVNGSAVPNLAADSLRLQGLDPIVRWSMSATMNDGVKGQIERTNKGGLHSILSRTNPIADGEGAAVLFPEWFPQYLADNATHKFGWSVWFNLTRQTTQPSGAYVVSLLKNASSSAGFASVPYIGVSNSTPTGRQRNGREATPVTPNPAEMALESRRHLMSFGKSSDFNRTVPGANLPSHAFYRATVEDLTVSGRTYADFVTQDTALYNAAFSTGGRYENDTFTNPTSLG